MHPLLQRLVERAPILTDGAWGTQLQERGLALGEFPDAWNLSHPERVAEVARAYVDAGSDVILTNTFGANRVRLSNHNSAELAAEINRAGVEISRRAAAGRALVFGSIGPSGKLLLDASISERELRIAFEEQADALARAGADALVVETMVDLDEAKIAVEAARASGLPIIACMVFDFGKNKDRTMMGATPEEAAQVLTAAGADVIGANCGRGIAGFVSICRRLRATTDLPLWFKPNGGLPQLFNGKLQYDSSPEEFATHAVKLIELGANFVGGCCGTNPDFIRAIRQRIHKKTSGTVTPVFAKPHAGEGGCKP